MQRRLMCLFVLAIGICTAQTGLAQPYSPIVAAINFCTIDPVRDAGGQFGGGAKEENRRIEVAFAYWRRDLGYKFGEAGEISDTQTIELCHAGVDPATRVADFVCPWSDNNDEQWLIYDMSLKPDGYPLNPDNVTDDVKGTKTEEVKRFVIRADDLLYGAPGSAGRFLYLKVTDTGGNEYGPYEWDTCPWPTLLRDSDDGFLMWGAEYIDETSDLNPWKGVVGGPHVCRRWDNGGSNVDACV